MLKAHIVDDSRRDGNGFVIAAMIITIIIVVVVIVAALGIVLFVDAIFVTRIQGDLGDELFVEENELSQS